MTPNLNPSMILSLAAESLCLWPRSCTTCLRCEGTSYKHFDQKAGRAMSDEFRKLDGSVEGAVHHFFATVESSLVASESRMTVILV